MSLLTPELAPQVVQACTQNAGELADSLGRALGGQFVMKPGETGDFEAQSEELPSGSGLLFAFRFGAEWMLAVLPAAAEIVPDWAQNADLTGQQRLDMLGEELSKLLVPESLVVESSEALWVEDLAAAVGRCEPSASAMAAPIEIAKGESLASLTLVWPVARGVLESGAPSQLPPEKKSTSKVLRWNANAPRDLRDLPPNVVSALRVKVPVSVNLAGKKIPLSEVIDIGPGSIITFDKACDAPLEVSVGGQPVATGEAVKVGERFGVRVQKMILPEETFRPMLPLTAR